MTSQLDPYRRIAALEAALRLAFAALIDADDTLRDQGLATSADRLAAAQDAVQVALSGSSS